MLVGLDEIVILYDLRLLPAQGIYYISLKWRWVQCCAPPWRLYLSWWWRLRRRGCRGWWPRMLVEWKKNRSYLGFLGQRYERMVKGKKTKDYSSFVKESITLLSKSGKSCLTFSISLSDREHRIRFVIAKVLYLITPISFEVSSFAKFIWLEYSKLFLS